MTIKLVGPGGLVLEWTLTAAEAVVVADSIHRAVSEGAGTLEVRIGFEQWTLEGGIPPDFDGGSS